MSENVTIYDVNSLQLSMSLLRDGTLKIDSTLFTLSALLVLVGRGRGSWVKKAEGSEDGGWAGNLMRLFIDCVSVLGVGDDAVFAPPNHVPSLSFILSLLSKI